MPVHGGSGLLGRSAICVALFLLLLPIGCRGTSKYGMDHPEYVRKYDRPYKPGEKYWRMPKQMIDARHVAGDVGGTMGLGGGLSKHAGGLGADLGGVFYSRSWLSFNTGLNGMLGASGDDGFALLGVRAGARVQTPTRLAPYAGIGAYAGLGPSTKPNPDYEQPNPYSFSSEPKQSRYATQGLVAAYPEFGLHWWCSGRVGVSVGSQYWMTSEGDGFWYHGVTLCCLGSDPPESTILKLDPPVTDSNGLFSVGGYPDDLIITDPLFPPPVEQTD